MKAGQPEVDKKWQVESDLRTMREYAEICADPKRKKAAMKLAGEEAEQLHSIMSGPDKREPSKEDTEAYKEVSKAVKS